MPLREKSSDIGQGDGPVAPVAKAGAGALSVVVNSLRQLRGAFLRPPVLGTVAGGQFGVMDLGPVRRDGLDGTSSGRWDQFGVMDLMEMLLEQIER